MCSQKVLHHHERWFVGDEVFWSLKTFEGWKRTCLYFRHNEPFLLKNISFTLATDFVHRKKNVFTTQCCFEKRTWKWQWKKTKSFTAKSSRILEDFLDPSWENKEISKVLLFFLVWWNEIGRNTFPLINIKLKQISNAQKKN